MKSGSLVFLLVLVPQILFAWSEVKNGDKDRGVCSTGDVCSSGELCPDGKLCRLGGARPNNQTHPLDQIYQLKALQNDLASKSGGAKLESWNCAGTTKEGYISNLQVAVDVLANVSAGFLYDGSMSHDGIEIGSDRSDLSKLDGAVVGHDQRFYSIQLVRGNLESSGIAVVTFNGFIDCIGDVSGIETLSCEIRVEK